MVLGTYPYLGLWTVTIFMKLLLSLFFRQMVWRVWLALQEQALCLLLSVYRFRLTLELALGGTYQILLGLEVGRV